MSFIVKSIYKKIAKPIFPIKLDGSKVELRKTNRNLVRYIGNNVVLFGEIPSAKDETIRKQKVENMVTMGFDAIINLMEVGEKTFSGELLVDYTDDLEYYAARAHKEIIIHRHPIQDLSITTADKMREILHLIHSLIEDGKKVYVHCWGGVGRTGTVVGCYLIEQNMASIDNVLQSIDYLKRTTPISERNSPETDEQVNFILNWPLLRKLKS